MSYGPQCLKWKLWRSLIIDPYYRSTVITEGGRIRQYWWKADKQLNVEFYVVYVTCLRRGRFGSFGRPDSLPDSSTSLSLTIGISAASIRSPGLSSLPKTRFPIAGSCVLSISGFDGTIGIWRRFGFLGLFGLRKEMTIQCRWCLFGLLLRYSERYGYSV